MPYATQDTASSAIFVAMPVFEAISLSKPHTKLPPPVIVIPFVEISATSSGGVFSSTE